LCRDDAFYWEVRGWGQSGLGTSSGCMGGVKNIGVGRWTSCFRLGIFDFVFNEFS